MDGRPGVRQLVHTPILIYYNVNEAPNLVEVLHFWHGSRHDRAFLTSAVWHAVRSLQIPLKRPKPHPPKCAVHAFTLYYLLNVFNNLIIFPP